MSTKNTYLTQGLPLSPPRQILHTNRSIGVTQKSDSEIEVIFKAASIFKKHMILVELICSKLNLKPLDAERLVPLAVSLFITMREHKRHIFLLFLKTSKTLYPIFQEKLIHEPFFRINKSSYLDPIDETKKVERREFLSNFDEMKLIELFRQSIPCIQVKTLTNLIELTRLSNISQHQIFQGIVLKLFMELHSGDDRRAFLKELEKEPKKYFFELLKAYYISATQSPNPLGLSDDKKRTLISWAIATSEHSKTPLLNKQQRLRQFKTAI